MKNLPDDWGMYYRKCVHCGRTYHLAEGCECRDEDHVFDEESGFEEEEDDDFDDDYRRRDEDGWYSW